MIFHAGTKINSEGSIVTAGGRVFAAVGISNSIANSLERSYKLAECIDFEGKYYRADIGKDILKYKQ
jgi:phosphoribosylamine--glycine ligase